MIVPISRVRSKTDIAIVLATLKIDDAEDDHADEAEDAVIEQHDLVVEGGELRPVLHLQRPVVVREERGEAGADGGGVLGVVEEDEQALDLRRLQELLRAGQRHLDGAVVVLLHAAHEDAGHAHVDGVERAGGRGRHQRQVVARLGVHRGGEATADDHGVAFVHREIGAGHEALAFMARSFFGSTPVAMKVSDLSPLLTRPMSVICAVVMRTRWSRSMARRGGATSASPYSSGFFASASLEAWLVDLQMSEAVADGALAQAAEGDGFVAAEEDQSDGAEDDDQQRDGRAAAVAEDVAKGEFGQHVVPLKRSARFEQRFVDASRRRACARTRGARHQRGIVRGEDEGQPVRALSFRMRSRMFAAVTESRFAVGSSASTSFGCADHGPGDGHALPLAAGELIGRCCACSLSPTCSSQLDARACARAAAGTLQQQRVLDVLVRGEHRT